MVQSRRGLSQQLAMEIKIRESFLYSHFSTAGGNTSPDWS